MFTFHYIMQVLLIESCTHIDEDRVNKFGQMLGESSKDINNCWKGDESFTFGSIMQVCLIES